MIKKSLRARVILVNFVRVGLSNLFLIFVNETLLHYSNEVLDVRRNAILKNELTHICVKIRVSF